MNTFSTLTTLASGCFWCTEAVFKNLGGINKVTPGYTGGQKDYPTYEEVCAGTTGHAEAVQIEFDPRIISYEQILKIFFATHNPTTPNQQGNDVGTQYRSVIFFHSEKQKQIAQKMIKEIEEDKLFSGPVVTTVESFEKFYTAEEYHQNYFDRNPESGYCQAVINPKLAKLRQEYLGLLKKLKS